MIVETVDTYIKLISLKPLNHKLCGAWHTHESSLDGVYNLLDMCCFLSWSCQTGCHTQLFSSPSKSCSLDLDSCSLCHIMYHRWWPHSHYSLQPHSLTPRWQSSNDMAVGWFDGITNSSLQQREDKKGVKKKGCERFPISLSSTVCSCCYYNLREFRMHFSHARGMAPWMAMSVCPDWNSWTTMDCHEI